jgi:hypothetical protein
METYVLRNVDSNYSYTVQSTEDIYNFLAMFRLR